MKRVHIVGGGLAGLSAAVALARREIPTTMYEAGPQAGGRCRSYFDREMSCRLDNGNHLLLSGNQVAMAYLATIGARDTVTIPEVARFPFCDLESGARWTVAPNIGRIPWWLLVPRRRVPGTRLRDYLALGRLGRVGPETTVAVALGGLGPLYRRLLEPLAIAALNTRPEVAQAQLLAAVVQGTLGQGGGACRPCLPREGLSESLVLPALGWCAARRGRLITGCRIAGLRTESGRVVALQGPKGEIAVGPDEAVVLAVPAWVAPTLLPGVPAPDAFEAILNLHYRSAGLPPEGTFLGLLGGTAEWAFVKKGVISVTISAANALLDVAGEALAERVWKDLRRAFPLPEAPLPEEMPPVRVVREKRATFQATAAQAARRPASDWPARHAGLTNVVLAGDWTATGLPATIEGAISSGIAAAAAVRAG